VKRDQKQRGRFLGGDAPFGWRLGEGKTLEPVPEHPVLTAPNRRETPAFLVRNPLFALCSQRGRRSLASSGSAFAASARRKKSFADLI
jgi:hypothetical protein